MLPLFRWFSVYILILMFIVTLIQGYRNVYGFICTLKTINIGCGYSHTTFVTSHTMLYLIL